PRPPSSPLFPYTTLFRSPGAGPAEHGEQLLLADVVRLEDQEIGVTLVATQSATCQNASPGEVTVMGELYGDALPPVIHAQLAVRSEEHTSELQSREKLVC